jgi:hypothetical protein
VLKKNKTTLLMFNVTQKIMKGLHTNFEHVAATAYHLEKRSQDKTGKLRSDQLTLEHISTRDFNSFSDVVEKAIAGRDMVVFKIPQVL